MTPEAERYLAKARQTLEHARKMMTIDLTEDARRVAYLVAYHAAEALIFDRTGKVTKAHKGAHSEFARLAVKEPGIDEALRRFLPRAYDLKSICDYELGPEAVVSRAQALAAIETATAFLNRISTLLVKRPPS